MKASWATGDAQEPIGWLFADNAEAAVAEVARDGKAWVEALPIIESA
ncbi:MAG: hypothetical protein KA191_09980 [Verrucomicrobia bacterium]|jgi:hypothetical protein|nr:hypothetical protein [Verrucomicrobiota bacterium]OQC67839.1 MAG: hypothetical protein BWX48_00416 [Verrucomicrobia bacterium ADurb.Bin006]MDI9382127.1 hypothetical protein [Verrucomicrobiota bacterium]NMD18660.1 hypothetical protein [Verrucomicrobiota bacterium]HNV00157.1 hypothetical protein [Verrucomicrobiota bacterium]